jgi:nucleoside 2-deoxyribosyltransferase
MKIYIAHSKSFDYQTELYQPIKASPLFSQHEFIFPHETDMFINSKAIIKQCDLVIAEVSFPTIGEGIELGWADDAKIPVVCIYRENAKISQSLNTITSIQLPYNPDNLLVMLNKAIESI